MFSTGDGDNVFDYVHTDRGISTCVCDVCDHQDVKEDVPCGTVSPHQIH